MELVPIQREPLPSLNTGSSNQQNNSTNINIKRKFITYINISELRVWFDACLESCTLHCFGVILFICLSMIAGILIICLTAPKSNLTCKRDFQRTMESSLVSSSKPRSVALGDLNNDQQMDVVVPNSGTDEIGIFISKGNGSFEDQQTYSTGQGSQPYSLVTYDFNNDSFVDIAVANYGTNNIGIFINKRNGTFDDQKLFSLNSSRPIFLATGDFNRDNRMDLVIVNYGTNSIGILLSYGNGSFHTQTTYSTGYDSHPSSLVVADFNNDTYLDIIVTNSDTDTIGIFIGYRNGKFTNQQTFTTLSHSNPSSIAVGDFNNDHKLDVVVANNGSSNIGIFFGDGNGSFAEQITYSIGLETYPQYVSIGDMNNDNLVDIIVVDSKYNQVHILPNDGNGNYTQLTTYDGVQGSRPTCVAVTDLNKNNQSDIVVVNYGTNNVLALIDYSTELSVRRTNYIPTITNNVKSVAVGDFNSDHIVDITYGTSGYLHIRLGVGDGTFGADETHYIDGLLAAQYTWVGDLNNDTKADIILADDYANNIRVFLGNGNGTFFSIDTYSTGNNSIPCWIALGDVNNDHKVDILTANQGTNTVSIFLGHGDGTFSDMIPYPVGLTYVPYSLDLGDLNHDSSLDMVVANDNGYILICLGYGNGSFIIWKKLFTGMADFIQSIYLYDFNNDDNLDIIVTNTNANNIGIFLGYENGTFGIQTTYFTGNESQPYDIVVADFNNDNILDIAATNLGSDEFIIFFGTITGNFEQHVKLSTGIGSKPYGIAAADFNNDTQLDLVVALYGDKQIAILIGYRAAIFITEIKYSTGSAPQPYSLTLGDFNNDNRTDIVVANSGTDNLSIMLARDNGTYDMITKYEIGTDYYPQYVIKCDIDKDGHLDIVVVNSKVDGIGIIMGYGNGTFAEQLIYSTGTNSHPVAVASGDVNNDDRLDLIVANEGTDTIGIFFGFHYTVFRNQAIYSSNDSLEPYSVAINDFNNDSYLDIAATFNGDDRIGIFLGDGNGSFPTIVTYWTGDGSEPRGIAVDDLNNDSRLDIVVANYGTNTVGVFLGYGNGSFTPIKTYSTGKTAGSIGVTIGDVNNDKRLDVVVANRGSNSVGVFMGDGEGNFSDVIIYSTGVGSLSWSVTLADFNNDNNLDIAVANYGTFNVGILLGYGNGIFKEQAILSMSDASRPTSITTGDFNNDNQTDIAVVDWNYSKICIFIGYGNGTFSTMRAYSSGAGSLPIAISVSDMNHDKISDVVVANSGINSIVVLFGVGDGSFLLGKPHSTGTASLPYALAIGDFNNDTRLDVVVANKGANNTGVFLGSGSEHFASQTIINLEQGSDPHAIAVYDLEDFGYLDIIIANYGTDTLGVLSGYGNGTFAPMIKYSTGNNSAPSSLALAHFNNDTYLDVVVTNSQTNNIAIYLGNGYGNLIIENSYSTGTNSYPYSVTTGDLNNDNITDIAVANYGISEILLFYGYGNGSFGNQTSYSLGYNYRPDSIVVKDLDDDNQLDIVVACHDTDHVEIFIKMCP